jgi:hypothetical protein
VACSRVNFTLRTFGVKKGPQETGLEVVDSTYLKILRYLYRACSCNQYTVRSESRCALIEGVRSDVHERLYSKTELNNYTPHRYCASTAV